MIEVSDEVKLNMLKQRLNKLEARPDAFKQPGAMRKIKRDIRNLERKNDTLNM